MYKDLTGTRFGKLLVVKRDGSDNYRNVRWLCRCDCGKFSSPITASLKSGRSQSCGCLQVEASRRKIRKGSRFGRLKVIGFSGIENHRSIYECACDCGIRVKIQAHRLKQGITTSCGCYQEENRKIVNIIHGLSNTPEYKKAAVAKRRARKIAASGSHTAEDIIILRKQQNNRCFYCQKILNRYHVDHKVPLSRGGSDGKNNICLACIDCNRKKFTKTDKEFLAFIS